MIVERIQKLLEDHESVPLRDKAGVITPLGNDTAIEARGIKLCLQIAKEEECKSKGEADG